MNEHHLNLASTETAPPSWTGASGCNVQIKKPHSLECVCLFLTNLFINLATEHYWKTKSLCRRGLCQQTQTGGFASEKKVLNSVCCGRSLKQANFKFASIRRTLGNFSGVHPRDFRKSNLVFDFQNSNVISTFGSARCANTVNHRLWSVEQFWDSHLRPFFGFTVCYRVTLHFDRTCFINRFVYQFAHIYRKSNRIYQFAYQDG